MNRFSRPFVIIASANDVDYPARFQFIAAILRASRGSGTRMFVRTALRPRLLGQNFRTVFRPDQFTLGRPARTRRRPLSTAAGRRQCGDCSSGHSSTRDTTPSVHRPEHPRKCKSRLHLTVRNRRPRRRRPNPSHPGRRAHEALGPRLPPYPARRPHLGGPRRPRQCAPPPHRGSPIVSPDRAQPIAGHA